MCAVLLSFVCPASCARVASRYGGVNIYITESVRRKRDLLRNGREGRICERPKMIDKEPTRITGRRP